MNTMNERHKMKTNHHLPELSRRELDVIKILWELDKGSVREVHNEMIKQITIAYPTTKTVLDRMVEKGYLKRESIHGIFVYSPLLSKTSGIAKLVQNFMENVLEIDTNLVANLFTHSKMLTQKEIKELQNIIDKSKE
jgi:BlaI family transcriptional regulator, penicillinase repressor